MAEVCSTDTTFGPVVGNCRGGFDFTLLFEDSILGLALQVLLLLLAPLRVNTLRKRRVRVASKSHLGYLKSLLASFYMVSSVILLALWSGLDQFKTKLSIASAALKMLGSLAIMLLSRLEHTRAIRPSHLLQFLLCLMFASDALRLRTLALMHYGSSIVAWAALHTSFTGVLLLLESLEKRDLFFSDHDRHLSSEETTGLFGQKLFWYLNSLFWDGYRKVLKPDDLSIIDEELVSDELREHAISSWPTQPSLLRLIWELLKWDFFAPVIPRLLYAGTLLAQPFLISAMITFVQSKESNNVGYGLIAAFALDFSFSAIFSSWYEQASSRFAVKLRNLLTALVYDRTLMVKPHEADRGSATVLMNVDMEKVVEAVRIIHELWAVTVTSGFAFYILFTRLGVAFVAPLITILALSALSTWLNGPRLKVRQLAWVNATERRVTEIAYAAGHMKAIRMLGLSGTVERNLTSMRIHEVDRHKAIRRLSVWVFAITNVLFQITTLVMYTTFGIIALSQGTTLRFDVLFSSLSAVKLVTSPLLMTLQSIARLTNGLASLERIEKFLKGSHTHERSSVMRQTTPTDAIELTRFTSSPNGRSSSAAIEIHDADFTLNQKVLLRSLNVSVPSSAFTMIVGRIASGKSLLLHALVGEMTLTKGHAQFPSSGISFCTQSPWLRNVTIRDNVIGEDEYDEEWYNTVLWACGLQHDLANLKNGGMSLVGSKGTTLSGGQKNRVALARAIYARKSIVIVDDILSGLDNATEKLVFQRVFGRGGLLRTSNTTTILATHATQWAQEADQILVMTDGTVAASGRLQALLTNPAMLQQFDIQFLAGNGEQDSSENTQDDQMARLENKVPLLEESNLDLDDEDGRRSGDLRSLLYFLNAIGTKHCTIFVLLTIGTVIADTWQFVWMKWLAQTSQSSGNQLRHNLAIFGVITGINIAALGVWMVHYLFYLAPRTSLTLHAKQLTALMHATYTALVKIDVGSITNRFSQDILLVDLNLSMALLNSTALICTTIAQYTIVIVATPPVAALVPFLVLTCWMIQRVYLMTSRQVRLMDLEAKAPLCTHFLETLAGITTIRAFGWSDAYKQKNNKLLDASQRPFYLLYAIQNWLKLVLELMIAGLVTVIVGSAVALRTKVNPGYLGLALVGAMDLGQYIEILVASWTTLETSLSAIYRIRDFANNTPQEGSPLTITPSGSWPAYGSISFRDVDAGYSPSGSPVLQSIDFIIKPGEKIGVCGRTGSGKSSLVSILFGLLHVQSGEILIDDVPINTVPLDNLRSAIVALPQESLFLRGSLRANLQSSNYASGSLVLADDEQMLSALQQVGLLNKLQDAADTLNLVSPLEIPIDNIDSLLSHGEQQLVCLVRAILSEGKIVVIDEATSSVDHTTELLMQKIIRTAFEGRTVIAIAHRLSTIMDYDRVVVLERGRVVEVGEPRKLMVTDGSLFRALVDANRH